MKKISFLVIILLVFFSLIFFSYGLSFLPSFNNSVSNENLTFVGNENLTKYFDIHKNSSVSFAQWNLSGLKTFFAKEGIGIFNKLYDIDMPSPTTYDTVGIAFNNTHYVTVSIDGLTDLVNLYSLGSNVSICSGGDSGQQTARDIEIKGDWIFVLYGYSNEDIIQVLYHNCSQNTTWTSSAPDLRKAQALYINDSYVAFIKTFDSGRYEWRLYNAFNGSELGYYNFSSKFGNWVGLDEIEGKFIAWNTTSIWEVFLNGTRFDFVNETFAISNFEFLDAMDFNVSTMMRYNGTDGVFSVYTSNFSILSYANNPWLEVGSEDGIYEWSHIGAFSLSNNLTSNLVSSFNSYLSSCTATNGNCSVPVLFHSDTAGILNVYGINVTYNRFPVLDSFRTFPSVITFGDSLTFYANFTDPDGDVISWVNFTLVMPNGTVIANNGSWDGLKQWNNTNIFTINKNGSYLMNLSINDGNIINFSIRFVVNDTLTFSPASITQALSSSQSLFFNVTVGHDSFNDFNFSFIEDLNDTAFTFTFANISAFVNNGTTFYNLVNVTSGLSIPDGVYKANISLVRAFDNLILIIPLTLNLETAVGNVYVTNPSTRDITMYSNQVDTKLYYINNTGTYDLKNCVAFFESGSDLAGQSFVGMEFSNTTIGIGMAETLTVTLTNPTVGSYAFSFLDVECVATATGLNDTLVAGNSPSYTLTVESPPSAVTLAAGGGGGGEIVCKESNWIIRPRVLSNLLAPHSYRSRYFEIYNNGSEVLDFTFSCIDQGVENLTAGICNYVTFNKSIISQPNLLTPLLGVVRVETPPDAEYGLLGGDNYYFKLEVSDNRACMAYIDFENRVRWYGFTTKLTTSFAVGNKRMPVLIPSILIWAVIIFLGYVLSFFIWPALPISILAGLLIMILFVLII